MATAIRLLRETFKRLVGCGGERRDSEGGGRHGRPPPSQLERRRPQAAAPSSSELDLDGRLADLQAGSEEVGLEFRVEGHRRGLGERAADVAHHRVDALHVDGPVRRHRIDVDRRQVEVEDRHAAAADARRQDGVRRVDLEAGEFQVAPVGGVVEAQTASVPDPAGKARQREVVPVIGKLKPSSR